MITTVTLNPSIDKLYMVDGFEPAKVTRVERVNNTAGGKGLNVTRVISLLHEPVVATGFLGGFNGSHIRAMLKQDGIEERFVHVSGETRCCINIVDKATGAQTELLEPGQPVSESEVDLFLQQYAELTEKSDVVTFSGSMPKGLPVDFYGRLVCMAKEKGCRAILDTSGESLIHAIKSAPTIIKPNQDEIKQLVGKDELSFDGLLEEMDKLAGNGIEMVAVSRGKDGVLVRAEDGFWLGIPPTLNVVNTVGCGDSMVAAFAVAISRKLNVPESIRLAVSVSSASALSLGTGYFEQANLDEIMKKTIVKKI